MATSIAVVIGLVAGKRGWGLSRTLKSGGNIVAILLVAVVTASMLPSTAAFAGLTDSTNNTVGIHQVPPATNLSTQCRRLIITYRVQLDWEPSTAPVATSQVIERSTNGGPFQTIGTVGPNVNTITDSGLSLLGSPFTYRVRTLTTSNFVAVSESVTQPVSLIGC